MLNRYHVVRNTDLDRLQDDINNILNSDVNTEYWFGDLQIDHYAGSRYYTQVLIATNNLHGEAKRCLIEELADCNC